MSSSRLPVTLSLRPRATVGSVALDDPALFEGILWRRSLAYLLDLVLMAVLSGVVWVVLGLLGIVSLGLLLPLQAVALAALPVVYPIFFISTQGGTPGMQLFDVEIRRWSGQPADLLQSFLAVALFYLTVPPTGFLILLVSLFNERARTLHDFFSGSVAVRASRLS